IVGPEGKVVATRTSATRDPKVRAEPEGLIDPFLKTLSFWRDDQPLAALHYYATHPMSYYGDGRVSSDFCALARHLPHPDPPPASRSHPARAGVNPPAGKTTGAGRATRRGLRTPAPPGMRAAGGPPPRHAVKEFQWRVEPVHLPPRTEPTFSAEQSRKVLA